MNNASIDESVARLSTHDVGLAAVVPRGSRSISNPFAKLCVNVQSAKPNPEASVSQHRPLASGPAKGHAVVPAVCAGAAPLATTTLAARSPGYPVVGRSQELNRRIAIHEGAGHAFLARCMGTELHSVSIIPGDGYEGRCLSKAYQSSLYEAPADDTVEIVDLCERAQRLMPELGAGRVEAAECFQRATVLCIELVGGTVAEQTLHPQEEPLPTSHDQIEAAAFAAIAVSSPRAVPAFLEYARGEAAALINDHPGVAMAIADGLIEHGILTGDQVDDIIVTALARETQQIEIERRERWAGVEKSAAEFAAGLES